MSVPDNILATLSLEQRFHLEALLLARAARSREVATIPRRRYSDSYPPSFGHQRIWFIQQLEPTNAAYHISLALRLTGPLNLPVLQQCLDEIVRRHEALRTTFHMVEGTPVQRIAAGGRVGLPVEDLRGTPEAIGEKVPGRLTSEVRRPFDLAQDLLVRARLLRLGQTDHLLQLTLHHIACDGWSLGILSRELGGLYEAFSAGRPSPFPELPLQYADFAVWQRGWLQGEVLERHLAYWRKQLEGAPAVLELPTDRPRPAVKSFRGACQALVLDLPLARALGELSRREGVTLYMTLLAAFQALLSRCTGREDIVVGTSVASRNRPELEGLIGFFTNMLVLRTDLTGNPRFRELLARVRGVCLGAYAHQDLPFERLVQELHPERHLAGDPLFQVALVLQNAPSPPIEVAGGLTIQHREVAHETALRDLTLTMWDGPQGLAGVFEYSTDLFDAATILRMRDHFRTLLEGIVADPDRPLSDLPLLSEAERRQLVVEWNDTRAAYPQAVCLHECFEAQVKRTPDSAAVAFEGRALTYQELNQRANQLAHYLKERGVGPEVLVAISLERSVEMVVALLGVLKAGGAYVPINPAGPKERSKALLEQAGVPLLLTKERLAKSLADYHGTRFEVPHKPDAPAKDGPSLARQACGLALPTLSISRRVVYLDAEAGVIGQQSRADPVSGVAPQNAAYVIFTSGSTGQPKGVVIEHRQIANYVFAVRDHLDLTAGTYALVQPLTVDSSQTSLFVPLITGGCLHLISEDRALNPNALADYTSQHPIDCLKIAPSHLAALLTADHPERVLPKRWLILGGEASQRDWVDGLQGLAPGCTIFNHYGPTEATVGMLTYRVVPGTTDNRSALVPLGRPLPNTQAYVLDRHLRPVPIGVPGELYIGGQCLARGYLHRPELTADRFIPHPFSEEPGTRLYRTGDLARRLPDDNLLFLGRIDQQIKVRGFRIEPAEIEAVLRQHPAVREALVVAREDSPGNRYLVAYLVGNEGPAPPGSELRRFLQTKLPDFMVPSAFLVLDAFPRTPHGKVDRKALPVPGPSTAARMLGHWEKLLKGIAGDPGRRISQMPLLSEPERHRLLKEWNETATDFPRDQCIHELFETQVDKDPEAVAVVFEGRLLTYRQLNVQANRLAHQLRGLGVGAETRVGLCVERSLEMVVGLLGILKAGGAYVPLDPTYPRERLAFLLEDSQVSVLLTQTHLVPSLSNRPAQVICLDADPGLASRQNTANPVGTVTPENLAYVLYTSGSTGTPKGVMIEHRSLTNYLCWVNSTLLADRVDSLPALTPLTFDASLKQLLAPLLGGREIRLLSGTLPAQPEALLQALAGRNNVGLNCVPSLWEALLDTLESASSQAALSIHNLRCLFLGGEQFTRNLIERSRAVLPHLEVWNLYGPTEGTANATAARLQPGEEIAIGRPIANTEVYVLDRCGQPVPVGVPGELFIGGVGLARGYSNRPEATAERFLPHPFSKEPGARLYKTGDLVRWRPDGNLEFLGRLDHQVKLRGYRIEPGEIEAVLCRHPQVRQAAVLVREDSPGDKRLAAYVVPREVPGPAPGELGRYLGQRLPEYMVPSVIVSLDRLPLTPHGKVDRQALPALQDESPGFGRAYVAPRTPAEEVLAGIWGAVLGRDQVGVHDNFFELGGHSLLAVRVVSQIRREVNAEVSVRDLFEKPTIEGLALHLLELQARASPPQGIEELLAELESISEESAERQLLEVRDKVAGNLSPEAGKAAALTPSDFHCPNAPSEWFGKRHCNLVIMINDGFESASFEKIAGLVGEIDPTITAVVASDRPGMDLSLPAPPTLIFSPALIRYRPPLPGRVFCGFPLSKSEEYTALEKAGLPVPKWVLLSEGVTPDLSGFDDYVVRKPDYGGRGAEVKVMPKNRVRWKPITTSVMGTSLSAIIQEFIYTGRRPVTYRVNTLFGKVLYSMRNEASADRPELAGPGDLPSLVRKNGFSIVGSGQGGQFEFNYDEEIIRLGESAHAAFPEIPLLGFDIVREIPSGKLYVLEANAIGYVWTFDSLQVANWGFSLEEQFDGLRKAAYVLAEKTQELAR